MLQLVRNETRIDGKNVIRTRDGDIRPPEILFAIADASREFAAFDDAVLDDMDARISVDVMHFDAFAQHSDDMNEWIAFFK